MVIVGEEDEEPCEGFNEALRITTFLLQKDPIGPSTSKIFK